MTTLLLRRIFQIFICVKLDTFFYSHLTLCKQSNIRQAWWYFNTKQRFLFTFEQLTLQLYPFSHSIIEQNSVNTRSHVSTGKKNGRMLRF